MILEKPSLHCDDVELMLGDYTDGFLPESLTHRMDDHIAECENCQSGLKGYQEVIELAAEIGEQSKPMPDEVKRNLKKALNRKLGLSLRVE